MYSLRANRNFFFIIFILYFYFIFIFSLRYVLTDDDNPVFSYIHGERKQMINFFFFFFFFLF